LWVLAAAFSRERQQEREHSEQWTLRTDMGPPAFNAQPGNSAWRFGK
jgi:hypothetical protein